MFAPCKSTATITSLDVSPRWAGWLLVGQETRRSHDLGAASPNMGDDSSTSHLYRRWWT
jgi:hypothetical protein